MKKILSHNILFFSQSVLIIASCMCFLLCFYTKAFLLLNKYLPEQATVHVPFTGKHQMFDYTYAILRVSMIGSVRIFHEWKIHEVTSTGMYLDKSYDKSINN